jgi:hypothetical protein
VAGYTKRRKVAPKRAWHPEHAGKIYRNSGFARTVVLGKKISK